MEVKKLKHGDILVIIAKNFARIKRGKIVVVHSELPNNMCIVDANPENEFRFRFAKLINKEHAIKIGTL